MEQSPLQPTPVGAFRFNTDSSKMEYYDGNQWVNITSTSPEAQTGGTRGVWMGGATPTTQDTIDYADLTEARGAAVAWSNSTRALISGGYFASTPDPQNRTNSIEYFTIAETCPPANIPLVLDEHVSVIHVAL